MVQILKKINVVAIAVIAAIATSFMAGCQKDDLVYSCDPKEDAIVKENIVEIRKMTSNEWVSVSENYKRPVFRAFTPIQRQNLWVDKLNKTIESFQWNDLEKEHIGLLRDYVVDHPELFSSTDTLVRKNCQDFRESWFAYAQNSLGWTMQQIASIAYSPNKLLNQSGDLAHTSTNPSQIFVVNEVPLPETIRLKSGQEWDCNCNKAHDFCSKLEECQDADCNETVHGCGWIWLAPCDGKCDFYAI
jgi:hypothetical protein